MAKNLYPLRNVPQDEADEMRALLNEHHIDFHETSAGFIGIGTAAIWVNDESQYDAAKALIAQYQTERFDRARRDYQQQLSSGNHNRFVDLFKQNPGKVITYILFAFCLIYLMARPFWF